MKSETVSAIHDFSLKARELMLKEVGEQLEGIYGLLPNGKFEAADKYPAINDLEEARETRRRLEQFIADENAAGISAKDARSKLSLEIAFTRLNRMVALKMMETRGLIRKSVGKGVDSNGFKRWVVRNDEELEKYEAGDLPQNAIGEGPRQEAYRHYLLWQCAELSKEIKVLFDPDNLPSRIFPRPHALNQLIDMMNAGDLEESWSPGGEETIGWVYQFFNENEKKDVFDRLYKKKQKIKKEDIPAATELFTPNWIVKWLVQNSLGRHWVQMHPESRLAEMLDYLVPLAGDVPPVSLKKTSDIRLLDPACGTMHFGLIAFDIFHEMYLEEMENAGKPGWPDTPSVNAENEIPAAIIANNIHGIDIDLRAVQLSALALYIKAKSANKNSVITRSNLGCADVIRFGNEKLEKFIEELDLKDSVYERILRGVWEELDNLSLAGSLLRFEVKLASLIEEEKFKFNKEKQVSLPGFVKEQFETEAGKEEFWEIIGTQIRQALDHYLKMEIEKGSVEFLFAGETQKSFHVLDILSRRYDIVATNPPYLYRKNMNPPLAIFLQKHYPKSKRDLYTAFIERCAELLTEQGRFAMITQQSFMFISTYEKMRNALLESNEVETMCHVGPKAFEAISGEKVNTTMFAIRKENFSNNSKKIIGTYFRLIQEPDAPSKQRRFETALMNLRDHKTDQLVFNYRQADFKEIPGKPWVYWITKDVRSKFVEFPRLKNITKTRQGLATSDNFRFSRFWWEIGLDKIGFEINTHEDAQKSQKKWFLYMKGGGFQRWFGNQEYVINFKNEGEELKTWVVNNPSDPKTNHWSRRLASYEFYFKKGITWSKVTSGRLSMRLSPGGFIFDVAGCCAFPDESELHKLLSILNSSVTAAFLSYISPTINFEVGHISSLPIPPGESDELNKLCSKAISLAKEYCLNDENSFYFLAPHDWSTGSNDLSDRHKKIAAVEKQIDDAVYDLFEFTDISKAFIEAELSYTQPNDISLHNNFCSNNCQEKCQLAIQWISYAVGLVLGRFSPGKKNALGQGNFPDNINKKLMALADPDSIMVLDSGHVDDLPNCLYETLSMMLGEIHTAEVVKTASGQNGATRDLLRQYLDRTFFKEHIKQYRKRPVYWLLQSPGKKYGIWVFHEKINPDTLYRIRDKYVEPKINLIESQISGLRNDRDSAEGLERRKIEKQISELTDVLDDVREFEKLLQFISEERGYTPHIDDGVLLSMAPLWELIPSWQTEPKKAWEALGRGDYDWSHQAMDHWPERVKEKCITNESFAIAHGLDH